MRHSERDKKSSSPEREQSLTSVGREHAQKVSGEIRTKLSGAQIELLLASPYRPATETAEIVRDSLGLEATVSTSELLAQENYLELDQLVTMLSKYSNLGTILLIGHDLQLIALAECLSSERISLSNAGVCCLEIEDFGRKARVLWKFNPSELDRSNYHELQMNFAIYRADPTKKVVNVNDLDFGPLLSFLTQEPDRLGEEEGKIKVEVVRSHEWELLLDPLLWGTEIFMTTVIGKFAEKFITWVLEQRRQEKSKEREIHCPSEFRVDNRQVVRVDEATILPKNALIQQMAFAAKEKLPVKVILEP
jgi:phosphohistidine phosphatase SixA